MSWWTATLTAAIVLFLSVWVVPAAAFGDDEGGDAAEAAAREAVQRRGREAAGLPLVNDVRDVVGTELDIVGMDQPTGGGGLAVRGRVEQLERAIEDLGARVRDADILVELSGDVLFDFDRAHIRADAEESLRKVALVIREKRKGDVLISGHTDSKGSEEYNQQLSKRRASAVRSWLATHGGIPDGVMSTAGYGETRPVAPNTRPDGTDNPEGRAKNRRVEIVIHTSERAGN